jgi:hypothetical protein
MAKGPKPRPCTAEYRGAEFFPVILRCVLIEPHSSDHRAEDPGNPELVFCWTEDVAIYPIMSQSQSGTQVGGDHYRQTTIQPWAIIDDWDLDFYRGNALKYLLRAGRKGPALEDLKKCAHYIAKVIENEEKRLGQGAGDHGSTGA